MFFITAFWSFQNFEKLSYFFNNFDDIKIDWHWLRAVEFQPGNLHRDGAGHDGRLQQVHQGHRRRAQGAEE